MHPSYKCDKGLGETESIGWGFVQALHPEDRDRYPAERQQAVSKGQPYEIEYRLLGADGSYHWFIEQAVPVVGDDLVQEWVVTCTPQDKRSFSSKKEQEFLGQFSLEAEEEIRESEQRYLDLANAMPLIVWTAQPNGDTDYYNQRWFDYTGMTLEESKGWGWQPVLHPDDLRHCTDCWIKAVKTGEPYEIEYRFQRADGTYRWHLGRALPTRNQHGQIVSWVGTCTDIHDQKRVEEALKESEEALKARAEELTYLTTVLAQTNVALEKRNEELDQFAYVASHDLKAPLRAIANLSEWIEEDISDTLNEDSRHQMNLLRGRVHRLEALIDGLLKYSRVGRINTEAEPVDVTDLLVEVINAIAPPPTFTVTVEPGMPTLFTQRLPLLQVFSNLLSNAIKHHHYPNGRVTVSVKDQGQFYEFAVADDGPGIAPQYHKKVFGIFQTLEARDKVENTGVGLAIVQKIVEGYGGRICLESKEGQGAIFRFTWPK